MLPSPGRAGLRLKQSLCNRRRIFWQTWLALGLMQLGAGLAGCGAPATDDGLLSGAGDPVSGQVLPRGGARAPGSAAATGTPPRVSRDFFAARPGAQVEFPSGASSAPDFSLTDRPPTGPAPGPGAEADFRDRLSCAQLPAVAGGAPLSLCFLVAPDVSSLALSDRRTSLQTGDAPDACAPSLETRGMPDSQRAVLVTATRDDLTPTRAITLMFKLPAAGSPCLPAGYLPNSPVRVSLSLD